MNALRGFSLFTNSRSLVLSLAGAATLLAVTGCASHPYYAAAPPPPPQAYEQRPPLIELADRNGFQTGNTDGARDAYDGRQGNHSEASKVPGGCTTGAAHDQSG